MNKGNVFLIVVAMIAILSAVIYFALKAANVSVFPIIDGGDFIPPAPGEFDPTASGNFPLKEGSRGDAVKLLQAYINNYHNGQLSVDGIWGSITQTAYALMASNVVFVSSELEISETEFNNYIQPHQHLLE